MEADPEALRNLAAQPAHAAQVRDLRVKTIAERRRTDAKFVDRIPTTRSELAERK